MTSDVSTTAPKVHVAIDVAKLTHQVLMELPNGKRRVIRVANTKADLDRLIAMLRAFDHPCEVVFEPTGDYHRPLAYVLPQAGCLRSANTSVRRFSVGSSFGRRTASARQRQIHGETDSPGLRSCVQRAEIEKYAER